MKHGIEVMVGKTIKSVDKSDDEIVFTFTTGEIGRFLHVQDCCESVWVDDVNGDWGDLIDVPLLVAEERTSKENDDGQYESVTWTFYTFRTIKGSVDVRWCGTSSGYYSESVDFYWNTRNTNTTVMDTAVSLAIALHSVGAMSDDVLAEVKDLAEEEKDSPLRGELDTTEILSSDEK